MELWHNIERKIIKRLTHTFHSFSHQNWNFLIIVSFDLIIMLVEMFSSNQTISLKYSDERMNQKSLIKYCSIKAFFMFLYIGLSFISVITFLMFLLFSFSWEIFLLWRTNNNTNTNYDCNSSCNCTAKFNCIINYNSATSNRKCISNYNCNTIYFWN